MARYITAAAGGKWAAIAIWPVIWNQSKSSAAEEMKLMTSRSYEAEERETSEECLYLERGSYFLRSGEKADAEKWCEKLY